MKKTIYTEYALTGNLVALGGNLWNQFLAAAMRKRNLEDGDLKIAATVFFEEIIPEMQNFMEQKLAAANRQVEKLKGPTTCDHDPAHAGGACGLCHAAALMQVRDLWDLLDTIPSGPGEGMVSTPEDARCGKIGRAHV